MDGLELLNEARSAGLRVTAAGGQLKIRGPRQAGAIAQQLIQNKDVVIEALVADGSQTCRTCRRPLDDKGCCWPCRDRVCSDCGRQTGSPFIARCVACGHLFDRNAGEPL